MKAKWPKEVPVLGSRDFCRGLSRNDIGQRCLLGWCLDSKLPANGEYFVNNRTADVLMREAKSLGAFIEVKRGIALMNDDHRNSKSLLARVWNRAMAKLGYVVNNPECDRHGRLKKL